MANQLDILDSLLEGFQVISPDYRYLYVNDAVVRQAKTTREALVGQTMAECFPGIDETPMFAALRRCMEQREASTMENEFRFPDQSLGWFELRFEPVPEGVAILSVDITARKRHEAALRRTVRALATLSRCNQTLVRAIDEGRFVQEICDAIVDAGDYRGAQIAIGADRAAAGELGPAASRVSFAIRGREAEIGTLEIASSDPDAFDADERALIDEIARDVGYGIETLRARATHASTEEQLIAAQRLEAVGRLAGGVAHDFNNVLSVILTYSAFAVDQLPESDPIREDMQEVREAGEQAAELTRQLLAFSRRQILEPRITDANEVVSRLEAMLRRVIGEHIDVAVRLGDRVGNVLVDPGKLEQVLMNLAVNARDAMAGGGKLGIETDGVELDGSYVGGHISARPGPYVRIAVSDTGTGMTPEVRSRIFEPFFTTKESSKGTGLGLSTVYGIVKQSGGDIWVYSEVGHGTTFKIYLPRVDAPAQARRPGRNRRVATGNETILLVEDEPMVRRAAERILRSAGYRVVTAASGVEAVALDRDTTGDIDLLLTDVVMPGMNGRALAERLQTTHPAMKVLFTSGYTDNAIVHHGVLDSDARFIAKPISAAELTAKVREVLDE